MDIVVVRVNGLVIIVYGAIYANRNTSPNIPTSIAGAAVILLAITATVLIFTH